MKLLGKVEEIVPQLFRLDRDKKYVFTITEYHKKRSLDANGYMWVLCTDIANVLRLSKEEVYIRMLKDYGQSEMFKVANSVDITKFGLKYFDVFRRNKDYTIYKVYKGSHEYDTKEMAILIDGIVSEAVQLGIPTISESELKSLYESYKGNI